MFPAPAFCYFSVGIWESLVGQALILSAQIWPFSLWYFLSLVVTMLQSQTQIFSAPGIPDLSFFPISLPPMENVFQSGYNTDSLSLFSFTLSHPLGFPKSLSFWNKEQNYFQTISVFSHAIPYHKATRPEAAGRERSLTERKRKKSTFQNIIWPYI